MANFNVDYQGHGKYAAIVRAASYINPLSEYRECILAELRKNLKNGDMVLFDLLLCNGNNFNRFAEWSFESNDENFLKNVKVVELEKCEMKAMNDAWRGKTENLSYSVLTKREVFLYATGKM